MKIILNGRERNMATPLTLDQLLEPVGYANRRVAVEVNREVVPRSQHAERVPDAAIVSRSWMRPAVAESPLSTRIKTRPCMAALLTQTPHG